MFSDKVWYRATIVKNKYANGRIETVCTVFFIATGLFIYLQAHCKARKTKDNPLLKILILRNILSTVSSVNTLICNVTGFAQWLTREAKDATAVSSPL